MSNYPGSIDSFASKDDGPGNFVFASDVNAITSAIVAVQTTLGANLANVPSGGGGGGVTNLLSVVPGGGNDTLFDTDTTFVSLPETAGFTMEYATDSISYNMYTLDAWFTVYGDGGAGACLYKESSTGAGYSGLTWITSMIVPSAGGTPYSACHISVADSIACTPTLNTDTYLVHVESRFLVGTPGTPGDPAISIVPQIASSNAGTRVSGYNWAATLTGYYLLGQW